jgi:hypothetical protein
VKIEASDRATDFIGKKVRTRADRRAESEKLVDAAA